MSRADVVRTFQKAGWSIANSGPGANQDYAAAMKDYTAHEANALLPGVNVPQHIFHRVNRMPVGNLYLNGKPPLVSMEANNHPLSGRDHFRIFDTGKKDAQGKAIYAVTSSRDQGIKIDPNRKKTAFTNHFTEKNADHERDFTLATLMASGTRADVRTIKRDPKGGPDGGLFSGDGKVYDVILG